VGIFTRTDRRSGLRDSVQLHALAAICRCGGVSQVQVAVTRVEGRVRVQELAERCRSCGSFG